ncbi:MAG TPA: glycosyltransferase [Chitinophagaceae bacterium]|nr:glycosyltransferase [Chitinophagaceae bacterium]
MQNKFKGLAIISDCIHMFDESGNVVTEVHIFCRQMQALASMFQHTIICCPFIPYSKNKVATAYTNKSIEFLPLKNVGGNTLREKLVLIANIPAWLQAFRIANKKADIVYLRFPNNLNIIGFFYFRFRRAKTFATYTGTWQNYTGEPPTYRFQKWLLKNFFKGPAWIYIKVTQLKSHLFKGISPSYTLNEWEEETEQVTERIKALSTKSITKPVFITVGALNSNKNQQFILDAFKLLHQQGFPFYLYIVGDGELKEKYENFIQENNLKENINICGKKNYTELRQLYRQSNFLIQATLVEGFGKVPIEGFFHGVIPILNNVALAGEMTGDGDRGFVFSVADMDSFLELIKRVVNMQAVLIPLIENGRAYARTHTLENWANSYVEKINEFYK